LKRLNHYFPDDAVALLDELAAVSGKSRAHFVREAIRYWAWRTRSVRLSPEGGDKNASNETRPKSDALDEGPIRRKKGQAGFLRHVE
jgi:Ribbon-helix-helix protein, copG family